MLKIGEFSNIARVSTVLLRHYDDIGLLKPIYTDPDNGYRYYSVEQLPRLNSILALKDLGLSLEQIAQFLDDNISIDQIQGMLKLRQAQIEQDLEAEQKRLRRVQARLKQIRQEGTLSEHNVVLKSAPSQHYLSIRERKPSERKGGNLYWEILNAAQEHHINDINYCMAIFHNPTFTLEELDWELGFLVELPHSRSIPLSHGRQLTSRQLDPIEQMATVVHHGPWAEMHLAFGAIGAWIEVNRYHIDGNARELYLNLKPPEDDTDFMVEVQIPVSIHPKPT